jgi:PAS domain S-box-containing protein
VSDHDVQALRQREAALLAEIAVLRRQLGETQGDASARRRVAAVESAVDFAIVTTDQDGLVTEWNTGAERILGWPAEAMRGQSAEAFFTPEDRDAGRLATEMRLSLEEGRATDERWHLRRDGSRFWASGTMMPLVDEGGTHLGFLKILRDRTEQRQAGQRLEDSEARYRTLFEALDAGFCIIEMGYDAAGRPVDYRFLEVNPAFERQTGLGDAVGRWMRDLVPTHEQHWFDIYGRVAETGQPARFENAAEGLGRWFDVHAFRVGDPAARHVAILFNDVSDRRRAELALRRSEAYWRGIFEQLREGFVIGEVVRDAAGRAIDWRILELNPAWAEMTGQDREKAVGRTIRELFPAIEDAWVTEFIGVAETGESVNFARPVGSLGRWYEGRAHRVGAGRFVVLFLEVTARRVADERVRQLASLVEQSADFIAACGTDGQMVFVNPAGGRLVGLDRAADAAGTRITDYVAREERDTVAAQVLPAVQRQGTWQGELRFRDLHDGAVVPVLCNIFAIRDDQGVVTGYGTVARDVRAVRRGERRRTALLELGDRLRDLRDPAAMSLMAAEIIGRTLQVSRAGYGYFDPDGATVTVEHDWTAPGVASIAGRHAMRDYGSFIDNLMRGETVVSNDTQLDPRMAGARTPLEAMRAGALVNLPLMEAGRLVAFFFAHHPAPRAWAEEEISFLRNVADRTLAAIERRQAEENLRSLAGSLERLVTERTRERDRLWELSEDLLVVSDYEGRILRASPSWMRLFGIDQAALPQVRYAELVHPEDVESLDAVMARMRQSGRALRFENRARAADGTWRWIAWTASPEPGGERLFAIGRDIHAEKEQAEARERLEEQLRQSQKMEAVGQLTGGLAHDFNNLLTSIGGSLELLANHVAQGRYRETERFIGVAQSATKRAAALTHRLLAFSRRQTLDPRPTDANRLVAGIEELVRRTVGPSIGLEVIAAGGLWPILIDPNQLENALLNLCINARDAMPDGGRLTIETANRWLDDRSARERDLPPGQYVSLCVSDNGMGMTADVAAKAFDPFFTTKPIGQGTGLGLSMTYGFVRQSGGQVRIYSEPRQGTTICLYLPRHHGEHDVVEPVAAPVVAHQQADRGETVLVVDDEPAVRMLVAEVLEDLGYSVIEAADAAGGLKVLRSDTRIDLVVSDVGLPGGMNGRQMADAGRQVRPALKVLFITGFAENAVISHGHLDPGMQVMTKPFAMEALATRIQAMIAQP